MNFENNEWLTCQVRHAIEELRRLESQSNLLVDLLKSNLMEPKHIAYLARMAAHNAQGILGDNP